MPDKNRIDEHYYLNKGYDLKTFDLLMFIHEILGDMNEYIPRYSKRTFEIGDIFEYVDKIWNELEEDQAVFKFIYKHFDVLVDNKEINHIKISGGKSRLRHL